MIAVPEVELVLLSPPTPLSAKVTPKFVLPVTVAVTVNEFIAPTLKVALLALVITGTKPTMRVKLCTALGPAPLCAVKVSA